MEILEFVHLCGLVKAQHGEAVGYRIECIQRFSAHSLGWGIRGDMVRIFSLQSDQFIKESVILRVRQLRVVQNIIKVVVMMDLLPEVLYSFPLGLIGDRFVFTHDFFLLAAV